MVNFGEHVSDVAWVIYHKPHFAVDQIPAKQEPARWFGVAAEMLGLTGEASYEHTLRLIRGQHPYVSTPLRTRAGGIRLYEMVYSAPKSVSVQALFDCRIPAMMLPAARAALNLLQSHANARSRKGANHLRNATRATRNIAAVLIPNSTNRLGEPQIHIHCGVVNLTMDALEVGWKACELGWVYNLETQVLLDRVAHNELARGLRQAGYNCVPTDHAFEIAGVPPEFLAKFSIRRDEVLGGAVDLFDEREELLAAQSLDEAEKSRLKTLRALNASGLRARAARETRTAKTEPPVAAVRNQVAKVLGSDGVSSLEKLAFEAKQRTSTSVIADIGVQNLAQEAAVQLDAVGATTVAGLQATLLGNNAGRTTYSAIQAALQRREVHVLDAERGVLCSAHRWESFGATITALSELRGSVRQILNWTEHKGIEPALDQLMEVQSPWLLLNALRPYSYSQIVELLAQAIPKSALHVIEDGPIAPPEIGVTVCPAKTIISFVFAPTPPLRSRIIFVHQQSADHPNPVLEAVLARLVQEGAMPALDLGASTPPRVTVSNTTPDTYQDALSAVFLNLSRKRRYPQILASNEREVAEITESIRRRLHAANCAAYPRPGDLLRVGGDHRMGKKRTYRGRQYLIVERMADGALLVTNGMIFPPEYSDWAYGYAVADIADLSPFASVFLCSPLIAPRIVGVLRGLHPRVAISAYTFECTENFFSQVIPQSRTEQVRAIQLACPNRHLPGIHGPTTHSTLDDHPKAVAQITAQSISNLHQQYANQVNTITHE